MKHRLLLLALIAAFYGSALSAQAPPPAETPAPPPAATPAPAAVVTPASAPSPAAAAPTTPAPSPAPFSTGAPPRRLMDAPVISVSRLPADNPFGVAVEEPPALPPKPPFPELPVMTSLFAAVRIDPTGKVVASRLVRDPVPSVAAESKRSFEQRWAFDPAVRAGQPVDAWGSYRLDMQIDVRPREEQASLTPITPATPLPVPFEWGDDKKWYDGLKAAPPADGTVALEHVDSIPNPKKTRWGADSYKGPFSCKFWAHINASGFIDKLIPIQVSDPVLIPYMRKVATTWPMRPARVKSQPVESWCELSVTGQISYAIDVKQINNLRKTFGPQ